MTLRHCAVLFALVFVGVGVRTAEAQCTATVAPTTVSVPSIGSTSALSVVTGTNCTWTATSSVGWMTITGGASSSGIGQVDYTVAANPTTAARTGTLIVAGQTITFTQATGSCAYTVTPTSVSVPSIGSTSALSMTTGTSCSWTATSTVGWITITGSASGTGISAINYTVAANPTSAARTGAITVAGQTITFTQATGSCVYSVTPSSVSVPSTGSTSALSMTTGTSCSWTAASTVSWITITSGASGSGLGAINYNVAGNSTGAARTGAITVAGQGITFTQAAPTCSYNVTPTTVSSPSTGGTYTLSVTSGTSCSWTAASEVSWITVMAGASASGAGAVSFNVSTTAPARTGTLTVAGVSVTISQSGHTPAAPTNLIIR